MIGTYRHKSLANVDKTTALMNLFPAFRSTLGELCSITRRELLSGDELIHWRTKETSAFQTGLSARQLKSVQNMTYAAISSWRENLADKVRKLITGSDLPDERKTVLYRINARHAWWSTDIVMPWIIDENGELVYCTEKDAQIAENTGNRAVKRLAVSAEDLSMARTLAKQAQKHCRFPNLRKVDTLIVDSIVAKPTKAYTRQPILVLNHQCPPLIRLEQLCESGSTCLVVKGYCDALDNRRERRTRLLHRKGRSDSREYRQQSSQAIGRIRGGLKDVAYVGKTGTKTLPLPQST